MDFLEDNGICGQEEIEEAVDERHIDRDEKNDRLSKQQAHWTREVLGHQFSEINLDFFLLGVDSPVLRSTAKLRGFRNQDDGWIGLLEEQEIKDECSPAQDGAQPIVIC